MSTEKSSMCAHEINKFLDFTLGNEREELIAGIIDDFFPKPKGDLRKPSVNAYHWTEETVASMTKESNAWSVFNAIKQAHNDAIDAAIRSEREPFIPSPPSPLVSVEGTP